MRTRAGDNKGLYTPQHQFSACGKQLFFYYQCVTSKVRQAVRLNETESKQSPALKGLIALNLTAETKSILILVKKKSSKFAN